MSVMIKNLKENEWIAYLCVGTVKVHAYIGNFEFVINSIKTKTHGLLQG